MGEPGNEWLDRLRAGDKMAADAIYRRYSVKLCHLAEKHMSDRLQRRVGADDVVQSVFRTFFRRTENGQFSLDHSTSLWHLLVQITLNKIRRKVEWHTAAKRDLSAELYDHELRVPPEAVAHEPDPTEAAAFAEELENLYRGLSESEAEILSACLQGYSTPEIAKRVGRTRWTVRRVLDRIGRRIRDRMDS